MKKLSGAAQRAHNRRVLIDEARRAMRGRGPFAVLSTVVLLERADALR